MFRYYASSQGRFVSPDLLSGTIGTPESLNRYAYTMNDPINRIDPSGLVSLVGGCSGDDWCSGAIDLAGGGFGDDPGRDTCPKDAPGCFNNGPEGGGGGGSKDGAAKRVLNNSDCFNFIMGLLSSLFAQQNTQQSQALSHMNNDQRAKLFQAQQQATQPMSFVGTLMSLNVTYSAAPYTGDSNAVATTAGNTVTVYPSFFDSDNDQVETFIHESFHSGTYNFRDTDIASALGLSATSGSDASRKWDKELEKHCGPAKNN
jgi:hypothetical protein